MMCKTSQDGRRGIALVIVLSMIVLITALVVSFTVSMRTERQAAHSMSENERTKLVSETALAHAMSILSTNIPQPVPPGVTRTPVNWAINPGLLSIITGPSNVTQIPLSSNPSATYVSNSSDANLNLLQPNSSQYPILGTADPMYVAWASLLQNPAAPASTTNPLVARYAFWIDDENAKINVNTAYGKPSTLDYTKVTPGVITEVATSPASTTDLFPLGHPGSVNISVPGTNLSVINPTSLLNSLKTYGAAKSPEVIKTALNSGADAETFYQQNKFFLTATSRDSEFNVFGKSKLYMYAKPPGQLDTKLGGGLFQRFRDMEAPMYFHGSENRDPAAYPGGNPSSDPSGNPFQDYAAMYYTAANLSSIFNRSDWPGMPARSFVNKWGGNNAAVFDDAAHREADQIAWNMVAMGSFADYGNYTPSTPALAATLGNHLPPGKTGSSGSINYPNAAVQVGRRIPEAELAGKVSGKAIIPAVPRPMVDEICVNILPEAVTVGGVSKFRLKFTASYGVWLPPGYPMADMSLPSCDLFVGLTHLEYTVTQGPAANPTTKATQADSKYLNNTYEGVKKMQALDNFDTLQPDQRITVLSIRNVPNPDLTPQFYARNGSGFSNSTVGVANFLPATVNVVMRMRLYVHSISPTYSASNQAPPSQLIPIWDKHDPGATAAPTTWNAAAPTLDPSSQIYKAFWPPADQDDCIEFNFDLDLSQVGGTQCTRSLRIADPRMSGSSLTSGSSRVWLPSWKDATGTDLPNAAGTPLTDSLGATHNAATDAAVTAGTLQLNKFAYVDMTANTALSHPSVGIFSLVPTGMQRGIAGSTFKLQPNATPGELPDWLLLDLFAPTVAPPNTSTAWSDIVKMNATAGKINMNAAIYPNAGNFSPPMRLLPLQALLTNTPPGPTVAQNIVNHTLASGGAMYAGSGKFYNYPGEICEIKGVADTGTTDFEKEATVRNLASAITTKSNTFCVWGVAQTIKKLSTNQQYDQYEKGDLITGEKRFQAIVERYVWPGADGVAGNGHVDSNGKYDYLTQGATQAGVGPAAGSYTWETLDGPDAPNYPIPSSVDAANATKDPAYDPYNIKAWNDPSNTASPYQSSLLEAANNPVAATMKYRVIYFKYLD